MTSARHRLRVERVVLLCLIAIALAACGGGLVPVHDVRNAPVAVGRGQVSTPQSVHDAIMRALARRGWQLDREGPDGIVATVVSGGHSATVLIQYNASSYSISYLDSSAGLKFNGRAIHRRYNDWIERLERTIRKELASRDAHPLPVVVPVAPASPPPAPPPTAVAPEPDRGATPVIEPSLSAPPPAAPPPAVAPPATHPSVTKPSVTKPSVTKPSVTKPSVTKPLGGPYQAPAPPPPAAAAPK